MEIMPDSILLALGWALAHSIWQGALAAGLLFVLIPRLSSAKAKYWTAYGLLLSVLASAILTFTIYFQPQTPQIQSTGAAAFPEATPDNGNLEALPAADFGERVSQWLDTNHTIIVALWLSGLLFFLLKLGAGLWQVRKLRTRGLSPLADEWYPAVSKLAERLGIFRSITLAASANVRTPLTLGWLKPLILLPIGFVNQLSTAEVEAVLAHELAHIARRDWVFNLVQALIESLFYYHPAIWWISQVIRRERENACDDAALAVTGNPIAFARALVQVQEIATPVPALALALRGKRRRPLLERVRRILNQAPPQQHQAMEKITASVLLIALLALVGFRANSVPAVKAAFAQMADFPTFFTAEDQPEPASDSLPKPKSTRKISREDDNGSVQAEFKDGKIARLNIDGKEIPEAEFSQHEALIEELSNTTPPTPPTPPTAPTPPTPPTAPDPFWPRSPERPPFPAKAPFPPPAPRTPGLSMTTDKDEEGNTVIRIQGDGDGTEVVVKNGDVWVNGEKVEKGMPIEIPGIDISPEAFAYRFDSPNMAELPNLAEMQGLSQQELEKIQREQKLAQEELERVYEQNHDQYNKNWGEAQEEWKENQKSWKKQQKDWQKQQKDWQQQQRKWQAQQAEFQAQQRKFDAENRAQEARNQASQDMLKRELKKDGLIDNPDKFSLKIDAKQLKVNGKKQSEEMRRKYAELIESATGQKLDGDNSYYYNYSE